VPRTLQDHPKRLLLASNRHDGYRVVLFLIVTNRFASSLEVETLESALRHPGELECSRRHDA
jgi:hypothetical protein